MAQFDTGSTFLLLMALHTVLSSLLHSSWWCHLLCSAQSSNKQVRQCMYNTMLRRICIAIVAVEEQCSMYCVMWLFVCTLALVIWYENHVCSVQYYIDICGLLAVPHFSHYLSNGMSFAKILLNMIFCTILSEHFLF